MNLAFVRLAGTILPVILLMACGGGGGGSSNAPNTLSTSDVWDVLRDRAARADTIFVDAYGKEPNNPTEIIEPRNGITCSGVNCSYELGFTDLILAVRASPQSYYPNVALPQNTPTLSFEGRITGRADGITFFRHSSVSIGGGGTQTFQVYGGWMSGGVFAATKEIYDYPESTTDPFPHSEFYGFSFGNSPGTNPTGTGFAEWRGAMIGMRDSNQNFVQGDVVIDIENLRSPLVNVEFSNIKDLVTGADFTWNNLDTFGWYGLTLINGTFSSDKKWIQGSFYGEKHEEVGGVFHTGNGHETSINDGITGAFGGTRQ